MSPTDTLTQILELARWAPSGDNTQPWRFEIAGDQHLVVHGHDTRGDCVYDLQGEASQLSIGTLLQTLEIAASCHGWSTDTVRRHGLPDHQPTFDLAFTDRGLGRDPLADFIRQRSVQRRPMRTRPLSAEQRSALEDAVGAPFRILWFEGFSSRLRVARLLFRSARLRLRLPEAFEVHQRIIAWDASESPDRIPDQALGANPVTLKLMRFGLGSWQRVHFANRFLAGTWAPRIELDWIPSLACAAHFVLLAPQPPAGIDDMVAAGKAVQRFWLTATRLGLWQQPEMTPLIFSRYARQGLRFTGQAGLLDEARQLADRLDRLLGGGSDRAVWMGRLGTGPAPSARSTRLPLAQLLTGPGA